MKTIYLMTLYNANNIGAFLQTYSTIKIFESYGYKVEVVTFNSKNISKKQSILKYLKKLQIRKLLFKYKASKIYRQIQADLKKIPIDNCSDDGVFVLGSDECWNLASKSFEHHNEYFGIGLEKKSLFSFASSANNCSIKEFLSNKPVITFSNFKKISVRDENTRKIVYQLTNKEPTQLMDPTVLYKGLKEEGRDICDLKHFILVYSYGLEKEQIRQVKQFAKRKKLRTVSVGTYNSWCDKNVVCSPIDFLDYLKKADYVVTSTFHGLVLSICLNKKFYCFCSQNQKIIDVLNKFDVRKHSSLTNNLSQSFIDFFEYDNINKIIEEEQKKCDEYLKEILI